MKNKGYQHVRVQSFASLLICRGDWTVQAYSAPLAALAENPGELEPGAALTQAMGRQFAHDARGWGQSQAVSGQAFRRFAYPVNSRLLDIACYEADGSFLIVLEPTAPGHQVAPDALVRRILKRARGAPSRQSALDLAMRTFRLALRADSVTLLRALPEQDVTLVAQNSQPGNDALPDASSFHLPSAIHEEFLGGNGLVSDIRDTGSSLVGEGAVEEYVLLTGLGMPSSSLTSFASERGFKSVHWYAGSTACGERYCLIVEHEAAGAVDAARRHATELALEVLLLLIDAEHPTVAK